MKRRKNRQIVKHHILPRSVGGGSSEENIIFVDQKKHEAYHTLFGDRRPEEILWHLWFQWGFRQYFKKKDYFFFTARGGEFNEKD